MPWGFLALSSIGRAGNRVHGLRVRLLSRFWRRKSHFLVAAESEEIPALSGREHVGFLEIAERRRGRTLSHEEGRLSRAKITTTSMGY